MKYDQSSVKILMKQGTTIYMDDTLFEIHSCDEESVVLIDEDGNDSVYWYHEIDLNEVIIYKTIILNP